MALSFLVNIWWLLVLVGIMILVHELGHFWAARAFDVKVEVFSFGFGPRLFGFRRGETDYRFSLFLFGGYVKMAGEQPGENFDGSPLSKAGPVGSDAAVVPPEEVRNDPRAMFNKPRWQRLIILATAVILWWVTGEVMLGLVTLGAGYRLFTKDAAQEPDNLGMVQFLGLLAALSTVAMLAERHAQ